MNVALHAAYVATHVGKVCDITGMVLVSSKPNINCKFINLNFFYNSYFRPEPIIYANIILQIIGYKFGENNTRIIGCSSITNNNRGLNG